ncbi:hypothetical protein EDB87DRAFT_1835780 [Lactarius vividus]|nr:hypothetical protein EDB87DRAFT_1835780 [Lactarius vividus]
MASAPEIALVSERPTLGVSSALSPANSYPVYPPIPVGRTNTHDTHSLPTQIARNSLDVPTSPILRIYGPSLRPPPSLTLSALSSSSTHWATSTVLRDDNPEEIHGLSSLGVLTPLPQGHRRKISVGRVSGIGRNSTDCDDCSSSLVRSSISNVLSVPPSPTNTYVDVGSDTSRPSLAAGFLKRTVLKQDAGLNVEPFAFKPLELAYLVDPKNLDNLERLGGVDGLLRGLGTNRHHGLSTKPTQPASRNPEITNAAHQDCEETTPPKPDTTISSPIGVPEGLQHAAGLGGGFDAGHLASLKVSARAYAATLQDRRCIYEHNILPQRPTKTLFLLMWLALQNKVLVLLLIGAVVSLALGLFQDFRTSRPRGELPVDWVEGVAVIAAIFVVVAVGSLNDWQKERQFQALNEKNEDHFVKVIRDGGERQIDTHQVVVGDVVLLEPGEVTPCDGVFLSGYNVSCDESSAAGESNVIKKLSYEECIALRDKRLMEFDPDGPSGDGESVSASRRKPNPSGLELLGYADCFIVSGSKVVEGVGSYVVTSVGTKSSNVRIVMAFQRNSENTPLQLKLNDLSEIISKIGSVAGGLLFAALLVRYFVQLGTNNPQRTSSEKGMAFVNILIIALTFMVVAVPEGLPLAAVHALAFATKRMSKEDLLVRVLGSCKTMANASVVCTDRTGTLAQNEMTVVGASVGVHTKLARSLEENRMWTGSEAQSDPNTKDSGIDLANLVNGSVRKFLQFHISTHFTIVIIMIVWALASSSDKPILGAVQLLWINIIMGTFATLALVTDPASPVILDRNSDKAGPFTVNMTKQILGQATYQIIITLALHFLGPRILVFQHTDDPTLQKHHNDIVQTLVFNAFVFAQIFNSFNCRQPDEKLNVFEGVSKNRYFMAIITIEVAIQVLICFVGGVAFGVTCMGVREWCISVSLGFVSLPLGVLIRLIPNEPCERVFKKLNLLPEREVLPTTRPDAEPGLSFAVDQVCDNLGTFAKLRGGGLRGSSFVRESRFAFPDPDGQRPLPAMIPSPDVSHVATPEWQSGTSGSLSDPVGFGRSGSSTALCEIGFEVDAGPPRDGPVWIVGRDTATGHTTVVPSVRLY